MLRKEFSRGAPGRLIPTLQGPVAFVPDPLPPRIQSTWKLAESVIAADRALSELVGLTRGLPNPQLIDRIFRRREALLSSRIEGTVTDVTDLALFEAAEVANTPTEHAQEVVNHIIALNYAVDRLMELPITTRLIRETHERLMHGVRGGRERPGELREGQNWIAPPGGSIEDATYIPPPPAEMREALNALEVFINNDRSLPLLMRAALAHYQFEAIHPFRDGNGRIGRLLISLMLIAEGALPGPILTVSAFFEEYRADYYELLLRVSQKGAWIEWIKFFLRGVQATARDGIVRARELQDYWTHCRSSVQSARNAGNLLTVVDHLFAVPAISVAGAAKILKLSYPSAQSNIDRLIKEKILEEATGRARGRIYIAPEIIRIAQAEDVSA